jgi:ATP-dependent Clp protease ATP-binding subunit ClpA
MAEISLKSLFGKLNSLCYKSSEAATVFCKMRGNPRVELVHFLHQVLQLQDSDLHRVIRHFDLNAAKLAQDITASLDRLPRGAGASAGFRVSSRRGSSGRGPTRRCCSMSRAFGVGTSLSAS